MSRPFIEYVQSQDLRWRPGVPDGAWRGVHGKVLSIDDDNGDASLVVRCPVGWDGGEVTLDSDEELYVLRGLLVVDGVRHGEHAFAFLPAGHTCRIGAGADGAVLLRFVTHRGEDPARSPILGYGSLGHEWQATFTEGLPPGAARKDLRNDPITGEQTWLLGTMPMRWGTRPERHPVVEEMFLLGGTLVGPLGTMYPGAYFWRPADEWHGPFGSLTGTLDLFRTVGGPLSTDWGEPQDHFCWAPESRPIVPDEYPRAAHVAPHPY